MTTLKPGVPAVMAAYLPAFFLLFSLLQTPAGYRWLGSPRTFRSMEAGGEKIVAPYAAWNDENHARWDAVYYKTLKEEGYVSNGRLHPHKQAFFPLFPLLWRWARVPDRFAGIFSWTLFAAGLMLLTAVWGAKARDAALLTLLPPAFVFLIPYSEGATFLAVAIGVFGAVRRYPVIAFAGFFAAGMSRPAIVFLLAALVVVELARFRRESVVNLLKFAVPVALGYSAAIGMMVVESGEWFGPLAAQKLWLGGHFSWKVRDWSHEGFFMTVPALFFVWLPCSAWAVRQLIRRNVPSPADLRYWVWVSAWVLAFSASSWYKNEGGFNGISRYMLATPFFYIVALETARRRNRVGAWGTRAAAWAAGVTAVVLFIAGTDYSHPFRFEFLGAALLFAAFFYLLFEVRTRWFWGLYVPLSLFWHAHIVNMFLCGAWIVT